MAALANRFPHHVKLSDIALRDIAIGMYLPATGSQKREQHKQCEQLMKPPASDKETKEMRT